MSDYQPSQADLAKFASGLSKSTFLGNPSKNPRLMSGRTTADESDEARKKWAQQPAIAAQTATRHTAIKGEQSKIKGEQSKMIEESLKRLGTIQPKDCQCLPEITKHMLQFLAEDKLQEEKRELESSEEWVRRWPALVKRLATILAENEQYQKGLVTARDLHIRGEAFLDETKDKIKAYEYLLQMIKSIPECREG